jgi:YegS/Rv2252/BmrU family lipid kinase
MVAGRALLIANPGARQGEWLLQPTRDAFRKAGVLLDVIVTESRGHGGRVAHELAAQYDWVFTLGGDGTAMEAINALGGTKAVGILPGGTGNLLARMLGIPLDVRRAVPALLGGVEVRLDLGRLGSGSRFAIAAGTGVDADMIAAAPLEMRRRYGLFAYLATASQSLWSMKPFHVRASVDGTIIERDDCVAAMIVNMGSVMDGLLELGPGISAIDGELDLCVFSASGLADAAVIVGRVAMKDFGNDRLMTFARGRHMELVTTPARTAEADGELIGNTPIIADIEPGAAPLLAPRRDG